MLRKIVLAGLLATAISAHTAAKAQALEPSCSAGYQVLDHYDNGRVSQYVCYIPPRQTQYGYTLVSYDRTNREWLYISSFKNHPDYQGIGTDNTIYRITLQSDSTGVTFSYEGLHARNESGQISRYDILGSSQLYEEYETLALMVWNDLYAAAYR